MATIDKLDISIYIQYARRTQYIEDINKEFRFQEASSIPPQTRVTDLYPKLNEIDILLGVTNTYSPWALFYPPKRFNLRRRSPFSFSRIGTMTSEDEEEDLAVLESVSTTTQEQKKEKSVIRNCIKQMHTINEWLGFVVGRIGQLLQG